MSAGQYAQQPPRRLGLSNAEEAKDVGCMLGADYGVAPILNFLVPQSTQIAWVAGRPFFMVTPCTSRESVFDLHLTQ
jgi:hypothetical protein